MSLILISILVFVAGAVVGSFLNVVIDRLYAGESIIKTRSYCDHCKKPLTAFELIPILSFLIQGGKCKKCGQPISVQYPLVEATTAALFTAGFLFWWLNGDGLGSTEIVRLLHLLVIISVLIVIFVFDAKFGVIPDQVVAAAILLSLILLLLASLTSLPLQILVGLSVAAAFSILILATRGRGMGWGDVKFGFWLGLVFGFPQILLVLFLAFTIGAGVGLILVLAKIKKLRGTVPFGPFLATGALISLFFGNQILNFYFSLLY